MLRRGIICKEREKFPFLSLDFYKAEWQQIKMAANIPTKSVQSSNARHADNIIYCHLCNSGGLNIYTR